MTAKERMIMDLIRENPSVSQEQLAQKAGMSRAAVSVHISNLMKKGYITGRGYILNEAPFVAVVGGANIDIIGYANSEFVQSDSNPGVVRTTPGGVGRNIAECLARMGVDTKLLTAVGGDAFGKQMLDETRAAGVDMQHSYIEAEAHNSSYLALLDSEGEMQLAISDMDLIDNLSLEFIRQKRNVLSRSAIMMLDCNLQTQALELALDSAQCPVYLDAVSAKKVLRAKTLLGRFDTIKLNKIEAHALTGIEVNSEDDMKRMTDAFFAMGVRRIVLTMGSEGAYWRVRDKQEGFVPSQKAQVVNVTGAGDSFTAALVYGAFHEMSDNDSIQLASCMARLTLESENSVSKAITPTRVRRIIESDFAMDER